MSAEGSSGTNRQTCPSCDAEQSTIATTCRECGASLLETESGGRRWLRWGAVGSVIVLGSLGTFLAIATIWEPHEEPETDIVWTQALGAVRDEPYQQTRSWYAAPAGDVVLLSSGDVLRGVARDTGRIIWRANPEVTGDVQMSVAPTVDDGVVILSAGSSLHVIDPATGELRWTATEEGTVAGHAAVAGGLVAVSRGATGPHGEPHIALHDVATGEERGRIPTFDLLDVDPDARFDVSGQLEGIASDGDRLYVSMRHWEHEEGDAPDDTTTRVFGHLVGVDPSDGGRIWNLVGEGAVRAPLVTAHGLVSVREATGEEPGAVLGIDPSDGGETWRWEPADGGWFHTAELVTRDRFAVLEGGDETNELVLLDVATGEEAWRADVPPLGPSGMIAASERNLHVTGHPREEGIIVWTFDLDDGAELWEANVDAEGAPRGLHADDRGPYLVDEAGGLHHLDPDDGSIRWRTGAAAESEQPAPAVHDRDVYVVGGDSHLRAFDADGEERWAARIGTAGFSQPTVTSTGAYAVNGLGAIRAVDVATGEEMWRTENRERLPDQALRPLVTRELVVAAAADHVIAAAADDGAVRWETELPAPAVQADADDGTIVVVDDSGALHLLDPAAGAITTTRRIGGGVVAATPVDGAGIITLTVDHEIHLVSPESETSVWSVALDDPVPVVPTIHGSAVYIVDGGTVRALDLEDGAERWAHDAQQALAGAPAVDDDRIVVATAETSLIVLDPTTGGHTRRLDAGRTLTSSPALLDDAVVVRAGEHLVALQ